MEITPTRLYLQATYGLSESLIQGEVTPDCYEIDRVTGSIRAQLGRKPYAYWNSDLVPLDLPWQQQLTLDDTALQALVALAATGDCLGDRSSLTLEWLLCSEREGGAAAPPLSIMGIWEAAPLPFQQLLSQSQEPSATQGLDSLALQLPPHLRPYRLHSGLAAAPGQRIATAWVTQNLKQEAPASLVDQILVVPTIQPEDLPWLKQAVGVVCEQGGLTCHGAILARELGLPAVVGVAQGTRRLHTGQLLFLDGDRGDVFELKPSVLASSPLPKPTITQSATDAHADSQEEPAMVSDRPTGRAWATPTAIASNSPSNQRLTLISDD
jgi:pyruvate,water dikinase